MKQLAAIKPVRARSELYLVDHFSAYTTHELLASKSRITVGVPKELVDEYPYASLVQEPNTATVINAQENVWYPEYPRLPEGQLPGGLAAAVRNADVAYCVARDKSFLSRLARAGACARVEVVNVDVSCLEEVISGLYKNT